MEEERLKHEKEFLSSQMFFKPSFANGSGPVDFQFGARNLGLGPAGCMMLLTKAGSAGASGFLGNTLLELGMFAPPPLLVRAEAKL